MCIVENTAYNKNHIRFNCNGIIRYNTESPRASAGFLIFVSVHKWMDVGYCAALQVKSCGQM